MNQDNAEIISEKPSCQFKTRIEAKLWLQRYGVVVQKPHKILYSNKKLYHARCMNIECPFIFKYRGKTSGLFVLSQFKEHACESNGSRVKTFHSKSILENLYYDVENLKPKAAQNQLLSLGGVRARYNQSYRALRSIADDKSKEEENSCSLIKPWLDWHVANNPGSYSSYRDKIDPTNNQIKFECCFFRPSLTSKFLKNSLPIIALDACHTKGNYKGVIMSATSISGDDKSLILAFAICPTENHEYWSFFISALEKSFDLKRVKNLVILSDREKGLSRAIEEGIPNANHSFCVYHIEKNIKVKYKKDTGGLIWKAAKSLSINEFNSFLDRLGIEKGLNVKEYLLSIPKEAWASSYFPVPRFGHVTSNIAESSNALLKDIRSSFPFYICQQMCRKICSTIITRRKEIDDGVANSLVISKKLKKTLDALMIISRHLKVIPTSNTFIFEVQESKNSLLNRVVNINSKKCSCKKPEELGFPCEHICAVIIGTTISRDDFIIEQRKIVNIRELYETGMEPVDTSTLEHSKIFGCIQLQRRGRRKKSDSIRIRSTAESITIKRKLCRSCGSAGHNKRTCRNNNSN
jgi:hypothetical protein